MTVLIPACAAAARIEDDDVVDEAVLAVAAFLARYRGRTLDAYRSDLRRFFQWATDVGLEVLEGHPPADRVVRQGYGGTGPGRHHD